LPAKWVNGDFRWRVSRQVELELLEQRPELGFRLGMAGEHELAAVCCRHVDIDTSAWRVSIPIQLTVLGVFMLALGNASYSIYLVQVFVLALLAKAMIGLGLQKYGATYVVLCPIMTVAAGYLFYRAVDTPLQAASRQALFRWRRRLAPEPV
jgi:hypothetical protein